MINVTYCDHLKALLVTVPGQRATLCFSGDKWSLWTYESNAKETADAYGQIPTVAMNIDSPWLLSVDESLYCVGSVQEEPFIDYATTGGTPWSDTTRSASFYILEYGRGGAIDRSVDDEDFRMVSGKYRIDWTNMGGPTSIEMHNQLILDKWMHVQGGYRFWGGTVATPVAVVSGETAPATPEETYLIPVKIVPANVNFDLINGADYGIERIEIRFRFDNTNWQPIFADGSSTDVEMSLPPERMSSRDSWRTRSCLDSANAYAASRDGDTIRLIWDGSAGTWEGTGNHKPVAATSGGMNLIPYRESIVCYIPMKTRGTVSYPSGLSQMGIEADAANDFCILTNNLAAPSSVTPGAYIWQQWSRFARHREDVSGNAGTTLIAQPVDWAYLGPDIALNSNVRLKLRGLAVTLLGRGQGTDVTGSWTQGIFNTLFAADMKTWMAQVVDYIGGVATFRRPVSIKGNLYPTPRTEQTIRDRIPGASPGQRAEFGAGVDWGNDTIPTFESNTYLIGDEQVDTIVTSDSVKGTSVTAMLFGFMRNPAERIKLQSVKAMVRAVGQNRRRKGR